MRACHSNRHQQSLGCACLPSPYTSSHQFTSSCLLQVPHPWLWSPRSRTRTAAPCAPWASLRAARPSCRAPTTRASKCGVRMPSQPLHIQPSVHTLMPLTGASSLALVAEKQNAHSNWVTSVAFSPDGKTIVSGSYDNTLKVWGALAALAPAHPAISSHPSASYRCFISSFGRR